MQEFRKRWLSLGVALASGLATQAPAEQTEAPAAETSSETAITLARAGGEGEGEGALGEGEGEGEGEGAAKPADPKKDDVVYLARLGQIRGHLLAGYRLYKQGHPDMARTHMKHPRDEIYAGLKPALEHRGATGFDEQLSALAGAVNSGADTETVEQAYRELEEAVRAAESVVKPSLKTELLSVTRLIRTAGEEYAVGVQDGKVVKVHEYQDAWGFTQIARRRLENLDPALRKEAEQTVTRAEQRIAELDELWPALVPGDTVDGKAARLFGTAARLEISALELDG